MDEQEKFARDVIGRLARIETQAKAAADAARLAAAASEDRHNNLKQVIDELATKRDLETIEARVEHLEGSRDWVVKAVVGAWMAGSGVVATLFTRKFGG
jgi:hypothetical protein